MQAKTIFDLIRGKMYTRDGTVIDPYSREGRRAIDIMLIGGWWAFDGTPIDPWARRALELVVDEKATLDTPVPCPSPSTS